MGANCKLSLAPGTKIENVAMVAAALLGHKSRHSPIAGSNGIFARVDGYKLKSTDRTGEAYIILDATTDNPAAKSILASDGPSYHLFYIFESGPMGQPALLPKCTAAKIALCDGLVRFFGGTLDYNDCDSKDVNVRVARKPDIHAEDDPKWSIFQNRILAVQPITYADIARFQKYASY